MWWVPVTAGIVCGLPVLVVLIGVCIGLWAIRVDGKKKGIKDHAGNSD